MTPLDRHELRKVVLGRPQVSKLDSQGEHLVKQVRYCAKTRDIYLRDSVISARNGGAALGTIRMYAASYLKRKKRWQRLARKHLGVGRKRGQRRLKNAEG
jgi:hypothetical protein